MPAQLRELRRETSDRAGRGRHPDDVALAQPRNVEESRVGGQAHGAERDGLMGIAIQRVPAIALGTDGATLLEWSQSFMS